MRERIANGAKKNEHPGGSLPPRCSRVDRPRLLVGVDRRALVTAARWQGYRIARFEIAACLAFLAASLAFDAAFGRCVAAGEVFFAALHPLGATGRKALGAATGTRRVATSRLCFATVDGAG